VCYGSTPQTIDARVHFQCRERFVNPSHVLSVMIINAGFGWPLDVLYGGK
jgi:hypothetical protein